MSIKKKRIIVSSLISAVFLTLIIWTIWGNTALELNKFTVFSDKLPTPFDEYRIAHVSDLHNTELGKNNENLLNVLKKAEPDIIAITGDLIDSRNTDIDAALRFTESAVEIAPCYYVTGNHEARISEYETLKEEMKKQGVIILEDECIELEENEKTITLLGVNDPSFQTDYMFGDSKTVMKNKLQELLPDESTFTVLLSHRPELFDTYSDSNIDLVLCGHAHGGQVRLPFVGGLIAPNQGLFPKYDAGLFKEENTNMVVSRGIGNSIVPLRFNNRPEVVLIELQSTKA